MEDEIQKKIQRVLDENGYAEYAENLNKAKDAEEMFRINLEWLGYEGDSKEIHNALASGMDIDKMIELGVVSEK